MASVKLTNDIRNTTIRNVMRGAFDAERKALQKAMYVLSLRTYDILVPKAAQKAIATIHKDFFYMNDVANIYVGPSERSHISIKLKFEKNVALPTFLQYNNYGGPVVDAELHKDWVDHLSAAKKVDSDTDALTGKIRQVVYSATTVSKLLEIWPESKTYLPPEAFAAATNLLPAVIVAGLNEQIAKATGKSI